MKKSLYKVAKSHDFSEFLNLGKSELKTGGNKRPAIFSRQRRSSNSSYLFRWWIRIC